MSISRILKFSLLVTLSVPAFLGAALFTFLWAEVSFGIFSSTWGCEERVDQGDLRICARNFHEESGDIWLASADVSERLFARIYTKSEKSLSQPKFNSRENADVQLRMGAHSVVELLIDTKPVGRFRIPEDLIRR